MCRKNPPLIERRFAFKQFSEKLKFSIARLPSFSVWEGQRFIDTPCTRRKPVTFFSSFSFFPHPPPPHVSTPLYSSVFFLLSQSILFRRKQQEAQFFKSFHYYLLSTQEYDLEQKIDIEIRIREGTTKLLAACQHPSQALEAAKTLQTSNERMTVCISELQSRKRDSVLGVFPHKVYSRRT